jgi:hypothetical protein
VTFTLLWTTFLERRTARWGIAAGLTFGALVLTRSFYVAWYPALWLWAAVALGRNASDASIARRLRPVAAFALASIALTAPWWIRNCVVLEAVMPTGTQGGIGIADGFSDSAFRNHGSWTSETADAIAAAMRADPQLAKLTPIEFEREHARRGTASAQQWIRTHRGELLTLSWWKFARLWESGSPAHGVLWLMLVAGLWTARRQPLARTLMVLLAMNSLTVVATYHTYERFLLPFRPLIHGFVAGAIVNVTCHVMRRLPKLTRNQGGPARGES